LLSDIFSLASKVDGEGAARGEEWLYEVKRDGYRALLMKDKERIQIRSRNNRDLINGLFQTAKRKSSGYSRFRTIRTIIFLIAAKLDFSRINLYVAA
jgi:ATP dependent DNA ligase domain